jgi:hypothetical protein
MCIFLSDYPPKIFDITILSNNITIFSWNIMCIHDFFNEHNHNFIDCINTNYIRNL